MTRLEENPKPNPIYDVQLIKRRNDGWVANYQQTMGVR